MTVENLFHVYVSSLSGGRIDVFNLNADTGEMSRKQTVGLSGKGLPLAVSPDRRRLYASVIGEVDGEEEPRYETFRIASASGELVHLDTVKAPARMAHISVDRTGRFLLGRILPFGSHCGQSHRRAGLRPGDAFGPSPRAQQGASDHDRCIEPVRVRAQFRCGSRDAVAVRRKDRDPFGQLAARASGSRRNRGRGMSLIIRTDGSSTCSTRRKESWSPARWIRTPVPSRKSSART